VRAVLECAGISDVLAKSMGTSNRINVVHATVDALKSLRRPEEVARLRDVELEDILPSKMLANMRR
jgi:small subunit ribosomal protein S5